MTQLNQTLLSLSAAIWPSEQQQGQVELNPRRPFTTEDARLRGHSPAAVRWNVHSGKWQRIGRGVFVEGSEPLSDLETALALVVSTGGVASHSLAAIVFGWDGVRLSGPVATLPPRSITSRGRVVSKTVAAERLTVVRGYRCTNELQTLVDLASVVDDLVWEQALESALRKRAVKFDDLLDEVAKARVNRVSGMQRVRRVLERRGDVPPTESLLETLMVQLLRDYSVPTPTRQVVVRDCDGEFTARVDLAWPRCGVFLELDGEQHKDQPRYDARRATANRVAAILDVAARR